MHNTNHAASEHAASQAAGMAAMIGLDCFGGVDMSTEKFVSDQVAIRARALDSTIAEIMDIFPRFIFNSVQLQRNINSAFVEQEYINGLIEKHERMYKKINNLIRDNYYILPKDVRRFLKMSDDIDSKVQRLLINKERFEMLVERLAICLSE